MSRLAWIWLAPIMLFDAVRSYVVCITESVRQAVRS